MTVQDLIAALDLPGSCRVDQRVPKKLLIENGAPTASDKRQINDGIEEIQWLAALKPNTISVPAYRDDVREYLEIAVLSVTLRATNDKPAKAGRLAELVHRAVPYPLVLLLRSEQTLMLSLAHKRWAQNEVGKVVLDGSIVEVALPGDAPPSAIEIAFMQALALMRQPQATLNALYQGWMDSLQALLAGRISGAFTHADNLEQAANRRAALRHCEELDAQIVTLRLAAIKENQMARQVAINLEIKALHAARAQAIASL
jgi:Domain of unknown function (DUF4391)